MDRMCTPPTPLVDLPTDIPTRSSGGEMGLKSRGGRPKTHLFLNLCFSSPRQTTTRPSQARALRAQIAADRSVAPRELGLNAPNRLEPRLATQLRLRADPRSRRHDVGRAALTTTKRALYTTRRRQVPTHRHAEAERVQLRSPPNLMTALRTVSRRSSHPQSILGHGAHKAVEQGERAQVCRDGRKDHPAAQNRAQRATPPCDGCVTRAATGLPKQASSSQTSTPYAQATRRASHGV